MSKRTVTSREFASALRQLRCTGAQQKFLQAHYRSRGRVLTTSRLAKAAGYRGYGAINLQYGLLAKRVAKVLRRPIPDVRVKLLVEFLEPHEISNQEWVLHMKPAFAAGLRSAGWVK